MSESIYDYNALEVSSECTFCEQFRDRVSGGVSTKVFGSQFQREIYADQHFVVVAALGQIVEGWLLIIPRIHYTSISAIPGFVRGAFLDVVDRVRLRLREHYDDPILFEHGSVSQKGTAGACIEHAHLHAVPARIDLCVPLSTTFEMTPISGLEGLWSSPPKRDYLYYETWDGDSFLIEPARPLPRQYFRRVVAEMVSRPEQWDWRTHIGVEKVRSVTVALRGRI
jgi:diadenosine tetraphosphate (Ap4A) HIT family hydrolase